MWTRVVLGLLLACPLTACGATPAPSPPSPSPSPSIATAAASTDMAWAQLTIALNERALQVLRLVPGRAGDARLGTFAADVAAGHTGENIKLRELLRGMGAPETNPHEGHDMPGMATPAQLKVMEQTRGEPFDRLFIASMRGHLKQCHSLAQSMQQAGDFPLAKPIAVAIESARHRDLQRLSAWSKMGV